MMENPKKVSNILYTITIFFNHFAYGISYYAIGPALTDLSYIYNVSAATLSLFPTFLALGYMIGSLGGIVYKWLNRQLVLITLVATMAVMIAFTPYFGSIELFFVATALLSIGGGCWDSAINVWIVEMWPDHQASVMQALQFMYGIGSIICPSLMSPFVKGITNQTVNVEARQTSLMKPFIAIGIIQIIGPIILLFLFIIKQYERPKSCKEGDTSSIPIAHRYTKLILVSLLLSIYTAAEQGYFLYSPTMFQYWTPAMTASQSAILLACLTAAFTVGRLLTAFILLRLKPDIIICYHLILMILALTWLYFGRECRTMVYSATILLGYGYSAMWPAIIAFTERHLKLTDRASSLLFFASQLMTFIIPFMIGSHLTTTPLVLLIYEAISIAICFILFTIVNLLIRFVP
ncbi:sodium-dependent glucose transporter 1A [Dermatophagoides farinae]|uniref:sodium-dependent glucose transporter 1A n=1 Tax=Dermatophagoides farinae TaxID=6954 RepID=UPI003F63EA3D